MAVIRELADFSTLVITFVLVICCSFELQEAVHAVKLSFERLDGSRNSTSTACMLEKVSGPPPCHSRSWAESGCSSSKNCEPKAHNIHMYIFDAYPDSFDCSLELQERMGTIIMSEWGRGQTYRGSVSRKGVLGSPGSSARCTPALEKPASVSILTDTRVQSDHMSNAFLCASNQLGACKNDVTHCMQNHTFLAAVKIRAPCRQQCLPTFEF